MTLSPCRTLQNVIQTQKCVLCLEYAKPNRCVFKCFANVSKPKEEDLKSTGKALHTYIHLYSSTKSKKDNNIKIEILKKEILESEVLWEELTRREQRRTGVISVVS